MIAEKVAKEGDALEKELNRIDGACFINAGIVSASRLYIVSYIKKHMDRFLYTDTDSIHLKGQDIPSDIPISDKMGDFKVEHTFTKCKYKGIKNYIIVEDGHIIPTIAGVPKDSFDTITKAPGVDLGYIEKAIARKDLEKIYAKPIAIRQLVEDIDTGTVAYEPKKVMLSGQEIQNKVKEKLEEIRKRREGWDWYTGKEIDKNLKNQYKDKAWSEHVIDNWNTQALKAGKTPTFNECAEYLRRKLHQIKVIEKDGEEIEVYNGDFYSKATHRWWTIKEA